MQFQQLWELHIPHGCEAQVQTLAALLSGNQTWLSGISTIDDRPIKTSINWGITNCYVWFPESNASKK